MKKATIALLGDPVLREKSRPVTAFHKKLHALIDTMKFTLINGEDGAALAAPQISVSKRIVVINYCGEYHEMVNPEILESSGEQNDIEGCLSLPGLSGTVRRAETVRVRFRDRHGKERTIERSGRMAICIQHEMDHLDGVLYIDRMDDDDFVYNDEKGTKIAVGDLLRISPRRQD
ncbi:MAG: peptide deformylase [Spirochaetes bacterium]|nr:peptide deformylase [Spirochaetota bacterium]